MIALYAAELLAVACFVVAFQRFGVAEAARRAMRSGLDVSRLMRDPAVSDREKERAARQTSFVLLRDFLSITLRSAAALAVSFLPVLAMHVSGLAQIQDVNRLMLSWSGIIFALVVGVMTTLVGRPRGTRKVSGTSSR